MNHDMIARAIDRALGRVRTAFRAVLTAIDSTPPIQLIQGDALAGEQLQDNELMQHYGFTSSPLSGTQMAVLPIGGKTAHGIIIATEHTQYRLKGLENGEVALYDDLGQYILLSRDGIVIKGAGLPVTVLDTPSVTLDTANVHMTGNLKVDGSVVADGDVSDHGSKSMADMRSVFNGHRHANGPGPNQGM